MYDTKADRSAAAAHKARRNALRTSTRYALSRAYHTAVGTGSATWGNSINSRASDIVDALAPREATAMRAQTIVDNARILANALTDLANRLEKQSAFLELTEIEEG